MITILLLYFDDKDLKKILQIVMFTKVAKL